MSARSTLGRSLKKFIAVSAAILGLGSAALFAAASSATATNLTVCETGCDATTIQGAINAASAGDTIYVPAGTFTENLTIDKQVHLIGAGSGAANGTIITSATASTPVVKITKSGAGTAAADLLTLESVRLTGATGAGNLGAGVLIAAAEAQSNIKIHDVVVTGNGGDGIGINNTVSVANFNITNSTITANTGAGLRVATAVLSLDGYNVSDTTVSSNGGAGLDVNPSQSDRNQTNFNLTDVDFTNNNTSNGANHQVSLMGFKGNATLTRVNIQGAWPGGATNGAHGLVISGLSGYGALGNITLEDVNVTGAVKKGGILIQKYSNVSGLSMTDVDVSGVTAPWGQLLIDHTSATAADIGNTTLKTAGLWNVGGVDATSANFKAYASGASLNSANNADAFTIATQIADRMDAAVIGVISIRSGHQFVTPVNALTGTAAGPLARAIAVSASGDVLHVGPGTYTESVVIDKPLALQGAQAGVDPSAAGRSGGETQLTGAVPVSITSDNVTVDGFEFTSFNTAVAIPSPFSGDNFIRDNVTISHNWMHDAAFDYVIDVAPGNMTDLTIDSNILAKTDLTSGDLIHISAGTSAVGANNTLTNLVITNNELSAAGESAIINQTGSTTTTDIDGLTLSGNWIHGAFDTATSISLTNVKNATVEDNHLDAVTLSGAFKQSTIEGNSFVGASKLNLLGAASTMAYAPGGLTVSNNKFANETTGQFISTEYASTLDGLFTVRDNSFLSAVDDVAAIRVSNTGAASISLAYNWWGSANGPAAADRLTGVSGTTPHLTAFVVDATKDVAPTTWPLSQAGLTVAPGFWPTEKSYVTALPAGTTAATVELEEVGAIDLGLVAGETPVEIVIGDVVEPDLAESPFVVGDGALFELEITGLPVGTSVQICVYSATEAQLWHFENEAWVDITTSYDPETGELCGTTDTFSPFAVAPEKADTVASIDATVGGVTAASSKFGENVVFDASIDQGAATGTLTVKIDGVLEATCAANALAGCLPERSDLSVGSHTITLDYDGDDNFKPSSASLSWTVNKGDVASSSDVTPSSSTHGDSITITGTYAGAAGVTGPTGTVTIYVDGQTAGDELSTCTLTAGTCSDSVTDLPAGDHTIYIVYSGDSNYNELTESFELTIAKFTPFNVFAGLNVVSPTYGVEFGYTYEFYGAANGLPLTGTVEFYLDPATANSYVGSCVLADGFCQPSAGNIQAGNHTIKMVYLGDDNYNTVEDTLDFTVAKATAPVVTPKTITQSYGSAAPTTLYTVTGLIGDDSLTTEPTCLLYASDDLTHEGSSSVLSASTPVGSYLLSCSGADAGANYEELTYGSDSVVTISQAATIIDYTGDYFLGGGSTTANLRATLQGVCAVDATVGFYFDSNGDGTYETFIGESVTNSSGVASYTWTLPTGVALFDVQANYDGTDCQSAAATATLVIGSSGDSSNGGGWYNLNGKMSFGYVAQTKTVKSVTTTTGQLIWNSKNGNKFKGTITGYKLVTCPTGFTGKCATINGTGVVSTWDGDTATWIKPTTAVAFSVKVLDGGTSTVCSTVKKVSSCTTTAKPDYFSINISNYTIVGESNTMTQLKGGNITVK